MTVRAVVYVYHEKGDFEGTEEIVNKHKAEAFKQYRMKFMDGKMKASN